MNQQINFEFYLNYKIPTLKNTVMIKFYLISLAMITTSYLNAQEYGGVAQVFVEDSDGSTRLIAVVIDCSKTTESSAKSSLEYELRKSKNISERFSSSIYYDIRKSYSDDDKSYGGSVSVKVKESNGDWRIINTTISCTKSTSCGALSSLLWELTKEKFAGEDFAELISFDIDSCK